MTAARARTAEIRSPRRSRRSGHGWCGWPTPVCSVAEAEDCVQEAWLRLRRVADPAEIRDLGAWLTTTVSRLALDALGRGGGRV